MDCPRGDGVLKDYKRRDEKGLVVRYQRCPTCGGHWASAFDANYAKYADLDDKPPAASNDDRTTPACPVCKKPLQEARGENIPPQVTVLRCNAGHGYFFPAGELSKFKKAQEAKINYFQLWQLPLSSVAGTLLTALVGIILSLGLIVGVISTQKKQITVPKAQSVITEQRAYTTAGTRAVTIVARTSVETALTLFLNTPGGFESRMDTLDRRTHILRIDNVPSGDYTYTFSWVDQNGIRRSVPDSYPLHIP